MALVASLTDLLDILGRGLASLGLLRFPGEEDETLLVRLEALDVGLERLLGQVLAARVDRDPNSGCQLAGNAGLLFSLSMAAFSLFPEFVLSHLQLSERETTARAHATVVFDGRAVDDGPEPVHGTRGDLGGLLLTGCSAAVLATRLEWE